MASRTARIDIRTTPDAKSRLQQAARAAHKSVSDFMLESALMTAEDTLANRAAFLLDAAQWEAFLAVLDAPPSANPRLKRLLREPGPFD